VLFDIEGLSLILNDFVIDGEVAKCAKCSYTTTSPGMMERHVNKFHKKLSPYKCDQCKKTFFSKPAYRVHLKKEHGNKSK
jgi:uncharacterized C2H2 Zn-finger protein